MNPMVNDCTSNQVKKTLISRDNVESLLEVEQQTIKSLTEDKTCNVHEVSNLSASEENGLLQEESNRKNWINPKYFQDFPDSTLDFGILCYPHLQSERNLRLMNKPKIPG